MNRSCNLLGSLRLLGRRGLERIAGERTMKVLEGGTEGKGIARGIVVTEGGEDSFGGKLSYKRIGERDLVARAGIMEALCSKDTVYEEGIEEE